MQLAHDSSTASAITGPANKNLLPVIDFLAQLPADLSAAEALTELVLTAHHQLGGYATPSIDTIASLAHVSRPTAKRALAALVKKRRVRIEREEGPDRRCLSNLYVLEHAGVWAGVRLVKRRGGEGFKMTRTPRVKMTPDLKRDLNLGNSDLQRDTQTAATPRPSPPSEADAAASFVLEKEEVAPLTAALVARHGPDAPSAARKIAREERASGGAAVLALVALLAMRDVRVLGSAYRALVRKAKAGELGDVRARLDAERLARERADKRAAEERAKAEAQRAHDARPNEDFLPPDDFLAFHAQLAASAKADRDAADEKARQRARYWSAS